MRVGVLTVSDRASSGEYEDLAGPAVAELAKGQLQAEVAEYAVVPDDLDAIAGTLRAWADARALDLILTVGGTGLAPRDVTPEATRAVIDREIPGFPVVMMLAGLRITPHAALSRAVSGSRGRTLIVNLPGSPKAARENLSAISSALPHGIALLRDQPGANQQHHLAVPVSGDE